MSERYRRRVSYEEFERYFREYPAEVRETARALGERRGRAEQEAVVDYGEGETLRLAREGGDWRVATDVVDFYDQSTPAPRCAPTCAPWSGGATTSSCASSRPPIARG
ncbi:MAG: hypothetical protein M5U28_17330 [Sandaracinaceae bacterium]|nr:hypothetical protein [Sandaracinaceae bacterium]